MCECLKCGKVFYCGDSPYHTTFTDCRRHRDWKAVVEERRKTIEELEAEG